MSEGKSAATPEEIALELISRKLHDATNRPVILSWDDAETIKHGLTWAIGGQAGSVAAPKAQPDEELMIPYEPLPGCGHPGQYAYTEDGGKHIVCLVCEFKSRAGAPKAGEPPQANWLPETDSVKSGLKYIADSPAHEFGGFHPKTVEIAKNALQRIEELERGAGETPAERWIPVPNEQAWWWHWNGEGAEDYVSPHIYSVLKSLTGPERFFIAYPDSRWCDEVGGLWRKISLPLPPGAGSTKEGK